MFFFLGTTTQNALNAEVHQLPEGDQPISTESDSSAKERVHSRTTKLMVYIFDRKDLDKVGREAVGDVSSEKLERKGLRHTTCFALCLIV